MKRSRNYNRHIIYRTFWCLVAVASMALYGCDNFAGYTNKSLFPENLRSVCLEMFENQTFRRGLEYELSDALAKRIEAETPYKIISNIDRADTILTGQITKINDSVLTTERVTGMALEKELYVRAVVNWKDLKTGQLLLDNNSVSASASYSEYQNQDLSYASALAANKLAKKIVELMEKEW